MNVLFVGIIALVVYSMLKKNLIISNRVTCVLFSIQKIELWLKKTLNSIDRKDFWEECFMQSVVDAHKKTPILKSILLGALYLSSVANAIWVPDCSKPKHKDKPACLCRYPNNWKLEIGYLSRLKLVGEARIWKEPWEKWSYCRWRKHKYWWISLVCSSTRIQRWNLGRMQRYVVFIKN